MWGAGRYLSIGGFLALILGLLAAIVFWSRPPSSLAFALIGWGPIALIGVLGGALAVRFHGRAGGAFPLTLLTCILLRLFCGLGGLALAMRGGQVGAYLTALFGTFVTLQVFEVVWFIRRSQGVRETQATPAR